MKPFIGRLGRALDEEPPDGGSWGAPPDTKEESD